MKKVLSAILAFILLLSIYPFSVYAEAFTDDSLILYYSFEDGTNATVGDNAEAFNVSFSQDGVNGKACYMDGNSSYLKL